jgi:hypothetical protein
MQKGKLQGYKTGLGDVVDAVKDHPIVFRNFTIFLLLAPLLFIFLYQTLPTVVLFLVAALFLVSLSPLYSVQHTWLAGLLSGAFMLSAMWGIRIYYVHVVPLSVLTEGRAYTNVLASQQAIVVSDAAVLQFMDGTMVDDQKSIGMKSLDGGTTYCVAPISDGSGEGRVNFWAVGINCCGQSSDFTCADAGQPNTHQGLVIPDADDGGDDRLYEMIGKYLMPASLRRDEFRKAITMAQSVHGVAADAGYMLVSWNGETREQAIMRERLWIAVLLAIALIYALSAAAVLTEKACSQGDEHGLRYTIRAVLNGMTPEIAELLQRPARYTRTAQEVLMLGFTLPVLTMVLCVTMFSFAPCFYWGNFVKAFVLAALGGAIVTMIMKPRIFEFGVLLLTCVIVGSTIGRWNFSQNSFHFCAIYTHKAYAGVQADASQARYSDAGKIYFSQNSSIDVDKSIGFVYDEVTYCAAPILPSVAAPAAPAALFSKRHQGRASQATDLAVDRAISREEAVPAAPAFVDFWAVGRDCCDARGGFKCFKDGELNANSGVVLRDSSEHGLFDDMHRGFLLAVAAAADNYDLPVPVNPMLIEWGHNLNALKRKWLTHAISVILFTSACSFILFAITSFIRPCSGPRRGSADSADDGLRGVLPGSMDATADFGQRAVKPKKPVEEAAPPRKPPIAYTAKGHRGGR